MEISDFSSALSGFGQLRVNYTATVMSVGKFGKRHKTTKK